VQAWVAWEADRDAGDHRPLGLVTLVQSSRGDNCRWSIGWLIVRPEARRRGVGRGLVATALAAAAAGGAGAVWAETDARWAAARAFWHNIGFEAV
jgi:GNAT superfamily N-acetyltransferase